MGRASIIMFFGAVIVFGISKITSINNLNLSTERSVAYFSEIQARNISNSTAEFLISRLGDSSSYRIAPFSSLNIFEGTALYSITDTTIGTDPFVKIRVNSNFFDKIKFCQVIVQIQKSGFIPATVKAPISTNSAIATLGNLVVDGRDHRLNKDIVPGSGTIGVWTTSTFSRGGNSSVGGTVDGIDYYPSKTPYEGTYQSGQIYDGGYPDTPDSALGGTANGFPPGELKSIAQSGINGSQYRTDPTALVFPLKGVTFIELVSGGLWSPSNIEGEGILIVHNSFKNASIENVNSGFFKGLVIVDDIEKIHAEIIGGLIVLSPAPPGGNCIGNGSGSILYSSEAIKKATGQISDVAADNFGFAASRINILSWFE
ncbi:MAG: hypothetical protein KJ799_17050 [Bacteroidetes bacterium]|nr:hypothetical protein [Bacteroidota bacterium]MBU1681062.1 hypothetical protein [Bacteroidota bacterium]MBU2508406.1 hypothetical protein [Bacteroidota bacterium]